MKIYFPSATELIIYRIIITPTPFIYYWIISGIINGFYDEVFFIVEPFLEIGGVMVH
jgi:hypothetical protein